MCDQSIFAGVVEVEVAELFNSAQPLVKGRAVDDQVLCCRLCVAGAMRKSSAVRASSTCRCST